MMVLFILTIPLSVILGLISTLAGIVYLYLGNGIGVIIAAITFIYTLWLVKATIFNKDSDFKFSDLKGWSKMWMTVTTITLLASALSNIWISSIPWAISTLIRGFISITITMYLVPFWCRYFYGVIIDGLEHHPDSIHHSSAKVESEEE
jgi:hypothetical protein